MELLINLCQKKPLVFVASLKIYIFLLNLIENHSLE